MVGLELEDPKDGGGLSSGRTSESIGADEDMKWEVKTGQPAVIMVCGAELNLVSSSGEFDEGVSSVVRQSGVVAGCWQESSQPAG